MSQGVDHLQHLEGLILSAVAKPAILLAATIFQRVVALTVATPSAFAVVADRLTANQKSTIRIADPTFGGDLAGAVAAGAWEQGAGIRDKAGVRGKASIRDKAGIRGQGEGTGIHQGGRGA
jgi:hypothetical protein